MGDPGQDPRTREAAGAEAACGPAPEEEDATGPHEDGPRTDAPATREQKAVLKGLSADAVTADTLAGDAVTATLTEAPANGAAIGGLKVETEAGWFAARPSGTEDIYKIYAESFRGEDHLARLQAEAQDIVADAFKAAGV